jgi:HEPN domain
LKGDMEMAADPKDIFRTAEVFRTGSAILNNHGMPQCMFPMVICSAFSLELYLKSLILIEGGTYGKLHDLEKLFSRVKPKSQKIIRASYETHKMKMDAMFATFKDIPAPKTDFDSVLHASAKAFENFRYAFEGIVKDQEGWMASPICDSVRERIVELQPDWANLK